MDPGNATTWPVLANMYLEHFVALLLTVRQVLPGNHLHLPIIWTSYQFPLPFPSYNLKL
jgi:hypothetical protein